MADGEEPLEDETCLNGFPEPDFVREEDTRNLTRGNFLQNVQLVRDEFEPAT